jgi:hypothetical protein
VCGGDPDQNELHLSLNILVLAQLVKDLQSMYETIFLFVQIN